jgi:aminoglycoside 6'-N-acetyltransferase
MEAFCTGSATYASRYQKVGFRAVGLMREYWRSPEGAWRDGLLMDLLAREFEQP